MPTFGSLFAGIGGLDLGLERAGWRCRWQVELDQFCQSVLARHWPTVARHGDVRSFPLPDTERVDLICGGFPCQPVSVAGKRLAQQDERWMWPEYARVVRALRPRYVLVENVPGLLIRGFGDVLGDLAACGYDAEWDCVGAADVGAPHRRDRVWILAYADGRGRGAFGFGRGLGQVRSGWPDEPVAPKELRAEVADAPSDGWQQGRSDARQDLRVFGGDCVGRVTDWDVEPDVGRVAHGVPARVDRLRSLGNAVVPQVAEWIGRRLMECLR